MKRKDKIQDLRNITKEELIQKDKSLKEQLFKLNEQRYTGRVDKPHMFSFLKRDIARINTVLNEKKRTENSGQSTEKK